MNMASAHSARSMDARSWLARGAQILGAVLVVSSIVVAVFSSHAGAASLSNGVVALEDGSAVASNPLSNQQVINVAVAAN